MKYRERYVTTKKTFHKVLKKMNGMIKKRLANRNCMHCGVALGGYDIGYCSKKCANDLLYVFIPLKKELNSYKTKLDK